MRDLRIWIFWLWVSAIPGSGQPPAKPRVDLIETGPMHPGGLRVVSGGGWIGLTPTRDGYEWKRFRIAVTGGNRVDVVDAGPEQPLFLLRGLPLLAAKPVHTCFDRSETGSFFEQNPILLTCEAQAYRVEVLNLNRPGVAALLQFSHRGRTQTLFRWLKGLTDQRAELVFAGDLDGDDKVDLVVDHGRLTLYLSTWAAQGQLVGRVASYL